MKMTEHPLALITEPTLADIIRKVNDQGICLPDDLRQRLDKWLSSVRLAQIESNPAAGDLVAAWRATRSAPRDQDEVWIVLLYLFRSRFARYTPELKAALQAAGMYYSRCFPDGDGAAAQRGAWLPACGYIRSPPSVRLVLGGEGLEAGGVVVPACGGLVAPAPF